MFHYTDGGLKNVWLVNGYELRKTPYGEGVIFHKSDGLTKAICMALCEKGEFISGIEFRYIRRAGMLLSQPALGNLIGVDGQSVARWEKSGRIPTWAIRLLRLFYLSHASGDESLRKAVEKITVTERLIKQKILVKESRGRWSSEFVDAKAN